MRLIKCYIGINKNILCALMLDYKTQIGNLQSSRGEITRLIELLSILNKLREVLNLFLPYLETYFIIN